MAPEGISERGATLFSLPDDEAALTLPARWFVGVWLWWNGDGGVFFDSDVL